jgi:hypothetical protein
VVDARGRMWAVIAGEDGTMSAGYAARRDPRAVGDRLVTGAMMIGIAPRRREPSGNPTAVANRGGTGSSGGTPRRSRLPFVTLCGPTKWR